MNVPMRFFPILLGAACLAGCVSFERAPAPLACDARLEGRWVPIANTAEESASLTKDDYAQVDPQCRVTLSFSQTNSRPLRTVQVDARGFSLDGQHYLAIGDADITRLLAQSMPQDRDPPRELKDRTPTQAVTLVRYRIEGDVFSFTMIDYDTAEKLMKEGVLAANNADPLNYQFTGDDAYLLGILRKHPELFKQDPKMPMSMRRAPVEASP